MQFEVGDHVYLRVSPTKGVQRFGLKGKLAPRYIGPFEILEKCGLVACRIRLPSRLAAVHNVFHISQLKKCVKIPEEIIEQQDLDVKLDLSYEEYPIKSSIVRKEVPKGKKLECTRFNGNTIPRKKLLGKPSTISNEIFPTSLGRIQVPNIPVHF